MNKTSANTAYKKTYAIFLLNLIFAAVLCFGLTRTLPRLHDVLLIWCLLNCLWLYPLIFYIGSPLLLAMALYFPIGVQFGYPNAGMIASVVNTTEQETLEFFDAKTISLGVAMLIALAIVLVCNYKLKPTAKQRKTVAIFSVLLVVWFLASILPIGRNHFKWGYSKITNFIPYTLEQYHSYLIYQDKIAILNNKADDWQINHIAPKYQNYLLIIGESAAKLYLSPYGYPVQNSPFLEQAYGIKYTNAIAPAAHTITSVPRLLSIPSKNDIEFHNNILTLANKAGFETYWISNQDKIGVFDNEISYIAHHAKHEYFYSDVSLTNHRFDYQLLPYINDALSKSNGKPKLIVVHLMGSHSRFAKRVDKSLAHFKLSDDYLADYLSSLLQTDIFIEQIYQSLQNQKQPFSLIYIADHGLSPIQLKHGASQFSLKVPLFELSSDDTSQITDDTPMAGFGFVWHLTNWLGIDTKNQADNPFIQSTKQATLDDIAVFDNGVKTYQELEAFDGELLLPKAGEMVQKLPHSQ